MSGRPRLFLVDGSSYIFRAFHALPPLTGPGGHPTNATYGFTAMLLKLLREQAPEYAGVVFDTEGPTERHLAFEAYKAQRPPMPEALAVQLPDIREVVAGLRLPLVAEPGQEADDLMGSLAVRAIPTPGAGCLPPCPILPATWSANGAGVHGAQEREPLLGPRALHLAALVFHALLDQVQQLVQVLCQFAEEDAHGPAGFAQRRVYAPAGEGIQALVAQIAGLGLRQHPRALAEGLADARDRGGRAAAAREEIERRDAVAAQAVAAAPRRTGR